ncbi:MAG TPA: NlpC/P60 family protein [Xanthobacteraceae bacterium]|jgi:cell wall-associated NlpC family hydrolase|nr:NlpC/P60 family protein [Hyphomicrobiaceae bacterium]HEX2511710.1 NlpC/P60 family protein [Xanthobacteraceae bacterium]
MAEFDPRLTPARPDLAAKHLEGKVQAARFVEGMPYEVNDPVVPVRRAPQPDSPLDTEALMGERLSIYEITEEGWAWGQLENDDYVGWLPASALVPPALARSHKVSAVRTLAFPGPSIKLPPLHGLPFGAQVELDRVEGALAFTSAGYIPFRHLVPIADKGSDFVGVAERFVGSPYLWGGKTSLGIDCSGLVQIALNACGHHCRRDTNMQEASLGQPVSVSDLRRGDLIFWHGHVAIARDAQTMIHANAFHMAVAIEPIAEAVARIRDMGSEITSVKRL